MDKLRVASAQMEHRDGDKDYNLSVVEELTRRAAREGARAVCFPECCLSSYMHLESLDREGLRALAEEAPGGRLVASLSKLAAAEKIHVLAGFLEIDRTAGGERFYNTYVAVSPIGEVVRYRKLHPFVNPALSAGNEYVVWDLEGWKAGVLICYDCNLWENWRMLGLAGVQLVFAPHQTGGFDIPCAGMGKIDPALWRNRQSDPEALRREFLGPKGRQWLLKWLPGRAYDNGCYVAFANGVGMDGPREVRPGGAMLIDPHGIVLAESWALGDDLVLAELDPRELELNLGRSHAAARRPELYGPLSEESGQTDTRLERNQIRRKLGVQLQG